MSGPSHGSPVGDSLWNENDQSSTPARVGDELRGLEQLVAVWVALVEDARRQRVRGEDDVRARSANAVGEERDEPGVVVPALDEGELGAVVERVFELVAVAGDREPAVVRGEHEPDDAVAPPSTAALDGLGDLRRPVLHAREDRQPELLLSAARVASVIAFSGFESSIPSRR